MSAKENFIVNSGVNGIQRKDIKKVDILFDFNGNNSLIENNQYNKCIACVSGSCEIVDTLKRNSVSLDQPNKTVDIPKDTNIEISNYSNDAKVIIAYYEGSVNNG